MSGYNVFPREIEELLFQHPAIKAAAVVGKQDEYRGELPLAFIVCNENATLETAGLIEYCKQNLARYKVPDEFRIVETLPKTAVGKVDKVRLAGLANHESGET